MDFDALERECKKARLGLVDEQERSHACVREVERMKGKCEVLSADRDQFRASAVKLERENASLRGDLKVLQARLGSE